MKWITKQFDELSTNEIYSILRLRASIFVVEQDCVYQDVDNKDQKATHIFALENDEVVAYTRVFKAGDYFQEASIGRVVVAINNRGKGLARILMDKSILYVETNFTSTTIRISAQTYLKEFYSSFGFKQVGVQYEEDGLPHIAMLRE